MQDIASLLNDIFSFLFSQNFSIFNVPLIFWLVMPVVFGLVVKLIKRGSDK